MIRYKLLRVTGEGFLVSPYVDHYREELVTTYLEHGWTVPRIGGLWVYRTSWECRDLAFGSCHPGHYQIWAVETRNEKHPIVINVELLRLKTWRYLAHIHWVQSVPYEEVPQEQRHEMPIMVERLRLVELIQNLHVLP